MIFTIHFGGTTPIFGNTHMFFPYIFWGSKFSTISQVTSFPDFMQRSLSVTLAFVWRTGQDEAIGHVGAEDVGPKVTFIETKHKSWWFNQKSGINENQLRER